MGIRQMETGEVTRVSATAKSSAKFDKYESKSEVIEYKAAADVTMKRKAEDEKKKKKKKDKSKDGEAPVEAAAEAEGSQKKKKDKEADTTADTTMDTSAMDTSVAESGEKKK